MREGQVEKMKANVLLMKPMKKTPRKLLILLVVLLAASFSFAKENKLSHELNSRLADLMASRQDPSEMIDVIIQFRPGAHLQNHVKRMLGLGAEHRNSLDVIQGGLFRIPASLIPVLAQDPDITYVSPDRKVIKASPEDYILDSTFVSSVFPLGYYGRGVGIAVI